MENLSYRECLPLIHIMHKGVLTIGFQKSLAEFGQADSQPQNQCARSIVLNLTEGKDFQTSISEANPQIPSILSQIITAGYLNSRLDYALGDIEDALVKNQNTEILEEDLRAISERYNQCSTSEICQGCLEREINQLISQAHAKKATTVELKQLGESFLEQKFIGPNIVHLQSPTHSLVYRTLLQKLTDTCNNDERLEIEKEMYQVKKTNLASYLISIDNKEVLQVVFKGIINH